MTTCIAAIVSPFLHEGENSRPYIVSVSDTRISFGGAYSSEGMVKSKPFHKDWAAMIGGNDVAQALPVIEKAHRLLKGKTGKATVVRDGFKKAFIEHRRELMEDLFLSSFDMTLAEFKAKGRKQLSPEMHADISFKLRGFKLECSFLVYGFDDLSAPHIFTVSNPGKVEVYDKPGFWAVGSGAHAALSMLASLGQNPERHSLYQTIYNVLASKYLSEGASDVGKETWMFISKQGKTTNICKPFESEVRQIWEMEAKPRTNEKAVEVIKKANLGFVSIPRDAFLLKLSTSRKSERVP